jgi:hypothetical protein
MTPKEKAQELYDKYYNVDDFGYTRGRDSFIYWDTEVIKKQAKHCALIAVEEVINNNSKLPGEDKGLHTDINTDYWNELKKELEKI